MKPVEDFALMLLVGFVRSWKLQQVIDACGAGTYSAEKVHAHAPFISPEYWHRRTPVRAYVVQQWPKFGEWMLAHEHDPKALESVLPKILALKADGGRRGINIFGKDRNEINRTRRHYQAGTLGRKREQAAYESNLRGAWNTVKK